MTKLGKTLIAGLIGAGALALTATSASAYIVCNNHGTCWHVRDRYAYPAGFGIVVHPDNWRWHRHHYYHWREHRGRGYWRNGVWISF